MKELLLLTLFYSVISQTCPCEDQSLCKPLTLPPRQEVFAFHLEQDGWKYYDLSKVTTIALFGDTTADKELLCTAHQKGIRLVWAADFPVDQLKNATHRHNWVQNWVQKVEQTFTDGVNVDIESPIAKDSEERHLLTQLIEELSTAFKVLPGTQITFDVAWSPECIDGRCYDWVGLANYTDFLIVMDYDTRSQIYGPCVASANSPFSLTKKGLGEFLSVGISTNQLVLALPWYGYDYPCIAPSNGTMCFIEHVPFRGVNCSDAAGHEKPYREIMNLLAFNSTGRNWDSSLESPWFNYRDFSTGIIHQVWYDDPQSLMYKYLLADGLQLRGVGMWNADFLAYNSTDEREEKETKEMWAAVPAWR